jgi:hypothetical protein
MNSAPQSLPSLVPLSRPLMMGEVLDAAFRLFRAALLRCLPYSGLAVLVLELPTLYRTFMSDLGAFGANAVRATLYPPMIAGPLMYVITAVFGTALFGVVTLRLHAISQGLRPSFRREIATVFRRGLFAIIATSGALAFPFLLYVLANASSFAGSELVIMLSLPFLWPTALLVSALPAYWIDGIGPFAALSRTLRVSWRQSRRMVGAVLATACMIGVFFILSGILIYMVLPLFGRADLVVIAAVSSMLQLVIGAFGVPFALAVMLVAYEDLKLRYEQRQGVAL